MANNINDVVILTGLVLILTLVALVMPTINATFNAGDVDVYSGPSVVDPNKNVSYGAAGTATNPSGLGIIESIGRAFFWVYDWGDVFIISALMNGIHIVIRLIGAVLIYRLVRSGAG